MSFKNVLIAFILAGIVSISVLTFGIDLANRNDAQNNIGNDERIQSFNQTIQSNLQELKDDTNSSRVAFETEQPLTGFGEIIFESIVSVGRTLTTAVFGFVNVLFSLIFGTLFGGSPAFSLILGGITSIIVIVVIFLLWRTYKAGE